MNDPAQSADERGKQCAGAAVQAAKEMGGIELDFSPDSLRHIEDSLAAFHKEGLRSNTHPNTVWAMGGYLGEMLVRNAGGEWIFGRDVPGGFPGDPNLIYIKMPVGGVVNPLGKVAKRLDGDEGDNVVFFYKLIASKCGPGGPGLGGPAPIVPPPPKRGFWKRLFGQ